MFFCRFPTPTSHNFSQTLLELADTTNPTVPALIAALPASAHRFGAYIFNDVLGVGIYVNWATLKANVPTILQLTAELLTYIGIDYEKAQSFTYNGKIPSFIINALLAGPIANTQAQLGKEYLVIIIRTTALLICKYSRTIIIFNGFILTFFLHLS